LRFVDTVDPPEIRTWGWQENLNKYLPNNTKILQAQIGARGFGNAVVSGGILNTSITLNVNKYLPNTMQPLTNSVFSYVSLDNNFTAYNSADTYVVDDSTNSSPYATITGGELNSTSNTVVKTIDFRAINSLTGGPGSDNLVSSYTMNYKYPITLSLSVGIVKVAGIDATILISPISVKYKW
jgi:hypothetical protein